MNFRRLLLLLAVVFWSVCWPAFATAPALQIHWLGLQNISADTNSAPVMKIWRLPETTALLNQTLDKLSRWPTGGTTNAASRQLRPLLDDLVSSEFYLEFYAPTNPADSNLKSQNSKLLLAIHLPSIRAAVWQTNLSAAFADLTGQKVEFTKSSWQLASTEHYGRIELTKAGDWTVLGIGAGNPEMLPQFIRQLPVGSVDATNWLEADVVPAYLANFLLSTRSGFQFQRSGLDGGLLASVNHLRLTMTGQAGSLVTHGRMALAAPWTAPLPDWQIPTNFLHESATSFTAMRGLAPWLAQWIAWQKTGLTPVPDQAYFWSAPGVPFQTYGLIPMPAASNQLSRLSARLVDAGNAWLADHAQGSFQWISSVPVLVWKDAMIISPWLKADQLNHQDCLLGGLYALQVGDTSPPLPEMIQPLFANRDLIYFQTQKTGDRIEDCFFITQVFRIVFHRPQLPPGAAGTKWLKQVETLLGPTTTEIIRTDAATLTLSRKSTLGFSALELHLLADWLESPQFPHGLHTFLAPPDRE